MDQINGYGVYNWNFVLKFLSMLQVSTKSSPDQVINHDFSSFSFAHECLRSLEYGCDDMLIRCCKASPTSHILGRGYI